MTGQSGDLAVQHYLVIVIDVLGQRSKLRNLKGLPTDDSGRAGLTKVLKDSVGVVVGLRRGFQRYLKEVLEHPIVPKSIAFERIDEYLKLRRISVIYNSFSDMNLIAVPLANEDEYCTPMNGVFAALVSACALPLLSLSLGHPLRGGVDVGVAVCLEGNDVYGEALESAYCLEHELAEYPRITAGAELIRYLDFVSRQVPQTLPGRWAQHCASQCLKMLVRDTDGRWMLDFMGPGMQDAGGAMVPAGMIRQALDFVARERARFEALDNHKLAARYYRLLQYMDSRKELW